MNTKTTVTKATKTAAIVTVFDPIASVRDARDSDAFVFPTSASRPQAAKGETARVARERLDSDSALISFTNANGWAGLKTQKILDSVRANGHACGMSRLNKLLNRDARGNALPVTTE